MAKKINQEGATAPKEKTVTHPQYAAFPMLFKRTGEARRIKGFRATRDTFQRAVRIGKALDSATRLGVFTPVGLLILGEDATALLKSEDAVTALILNGFEIIPANTQSDAIDGFLSARGMLSLSQSDMFDGSDE
jgi:hypothetical protein